MASYHRVLKTFGRTVDQKTAECDLDIHPWNLRVNGNRLDGKIRLVGYVDVFFLFSYTGESRFEKGIVIYKDDDTIHKILEKQNITYEEIGLKILNENEVDAFNKKRAAEKDAASGATGEKETSFFKRKKETDQDTTNTTADEKEKPKSNKKKAEQAPVKRVFSFEDDPGNPFYKITSLGHEVGIQTRYDSDELQKFEIEILRPSDFTQKRKTRRGINQHDLGDLVMDVFRVATITQAELLGFIAGKTIGGSTIQDLTQKYMKAMAGSSSSGNIALSGQWTRT